MGKKPLPAEEAEIKDAIKKHRDIYLMYCRQFLAAPIHLKVFEDAVRSLKKPTRVTKINNLITVRSITQTQLS